MNCQNCGEPVREGAKFCSRCGCSVKSNDIFSISDKTLTVDDMKKREEMARKKASLQGTDNTQNDDAASNQNMKNYQMGKQMEDLKNSPVLPQTEICDFNKSCDDQHKKTIDSDSTQKNYLKPEINTESKPPKKVKKQNGVTRIICIFLSILLFVSLLLSLALTFIHTSYSSNKIEKFIKNEEIYKLKLPENEDGDIKSVSDVVYDSVVYYIDSDLIVSRGDVKNLLKKRMIKNFISEIAVEYRDYIFLGTISEGITPERFADFMIENKADILSALAKDSRSAELERFVDEHELFDREYILEEAKFYLGDSTSIKALDEDYGDDISSVRFFISEDFMLIMWCITAALMLTIVLLSMTNIVNVLSYTGAVFAAVGGVLYIARLIILSIVGSSINGVIYKIADLFVSKLSLFGILILSIGVVMIISRIIVSVVRKIRQIKYS